MSHKRLEGGIYRQKKKNKDLERECRCILEQVFGGNWIRSRLEGKGWEKFLWRWGFWVLVCVRWGPLEDVSRVITWAKLQSPWLLSGIRDSGGAGAMAGRPGQRNDSKFKQVGTAAMVTSGRFWIYFKERTEFTDRTYWLMRQRSQEIIRCYDLSQCFSNISGRQNPQAQVKWLLGLTSWVLDSVGLAWSLRHTTLPTGKTEVPITELRKTTRFLKKIESVVHLWALLNLRCLNSMTPQNPWPQSNHRKTSHTPNLRDILQSTDQYSSNSHQRNGTTECHRWKVTKATQDLQSILGHLWKPVTSE